MACYEISKLQIIFYNIGSKVTRLGDFFCKRDKAKINWQKLATFAQAFT
jgi:hypothetical protein